VYPVDLLDRDAVRGVFAARAFDAVIHFAGLKAVGESVRKPLENYENNLVGTLNLLKAMGESACKVLVFSSSATVYGPHNPVPYTETMPTSATNPYGWTKVMIEQILRDVCAADPGMAAVSLRYFNPVGAHESGLIGEDPQGIPNNLTPYIAKVAAGALPELKVTGADYDTPDGTGVRDYLHITDLAEGHIAALRYAETHPGCAEINLGTGKGTSVLELLAAYERACGHSIPRRIAERRPGDVASCWADARKAKELLGWEATRSIDEMVRSSWKFVSSR
jgi:UDP-glucose 4-epimerase